MEQLMMVLLACVMATLYIIVAGSINRFDGETMKSSLVAVILVAGFYALLWVSCYVLVWK